ncbi:hypothetical protein ACHHYP_02229 [Achlya hypogyna]|uniref:Uncharacterized protein n=1 Tax=Achlya hypogyna TaxID=1202772 RepID=A0A1V9ZS81_ACHHY|nr:hypothetical protein ACHHYP_02229 [Achlya hypogyna]
MENKRCKVDPVKGSAENVLTSAVLLPVISSFSQHCLDVCPDLYTVFDMNEIDKFWEDYIDHHDYRGRAYYGHVLMSLHRRHVANGYLAPLDYTYARPTEDDEDSDATLLSGDYDDDSHKDFDKVDVDALVAQAKASDVDALALLRALKIRARIDEYLTRLRTDFEAVAGLGGDDDKTISGFRPIMFKHMCLQGKKTWGRDELAAIFGEARVMFNEDGAGLPPGLASHWLNMNVNSGECRACALSKLPVEQWLPSDGDNEFDASCMINEGKEDICRIYGLHPKMGDDDHLEEALGQLHWNKDEHLMMCSDAILPLRQFMTTELHDVKLVQIGLIPGAPRIGTSLAAGLTDDGYLVGAYFIFTWW